MDKQQFLLWQEFKRSLRIPYMVLHDGIIKQLIECEFSDAVYAYMIRKIIDVDDMHALESLLSQVTSTFKDGTIVNFGTLSNKELKIVINELMFNLGSQAYVSTMLHIETMVRFFCYIRYNDLEFDKDMLDVLLIHIVYYAKSRSNDCVYHKRLSRQMDHIVFNYDFTEDSKANVMIEHLSIIIRHNLMLSDDIEYLFFGDGDYATTLQVRENVYDQSIRRANYLKLTNSNQ